MKEVPVAVEVCRGEFVTVRRGELFTGEDELHPQLALGFLHFGEEHHLAATSRSWCPRRVAHFVAEVVTSCHAHTFNVVTVRSNLANGHRKIVDIGKK